MGVLFTAPSLRAAPLQELNTDNGRLRVGIHQMQPCVTIPTTGILADSTGFEIELFQEIGRRLKLDYEFVQADSLQDLLHGVGQNRFNIGIAGITINETREKNGIDFSHRVLDSGLAIMVKGKPGLSIWKIICIVFSREVILSVLFFFAFITVMGHLIWLLDLGADSIHDGYKTGVVDAIWFAFSLATTCGLGDVSTKKTTARIGGVFTWLIGTLVIGVMYSLINSAMTAERITTLIPSPTELRFKTVGTKEGSTSVNTAKELGAKVITASSIDGAYQLLLDGRVDVVVFDAPTLQNYAKNEGKGSVTVGQMFDRQDYGFAFPESSPLREDFNRTLLQLRENGFYQTLHNKYFGD